MALAVVTGGASLVAMGVGFAIGATASVVSQGVTNVINGNAINRERDFRKIYPQIPNNIENILQMIA